MDTNCPLLVVDPWRALTLDLPRLEGLGRRLTLRALLALSGGTVAVEGAERLAAAPRPAIFALTHHNAWEAVLAPATLVALRGGRPVRFLVDWMFVDLPWTAWLVRQSAPIPVYRKRARFGLGEARRLRRRESAIARALAALAVGEDVGIYPEGRRNPDPWRLGAARRGLAYLALRGGAPVVPVGIDFPSRERLRRTPRAGRFVLRVGEAMGFADERAAWLAAPAGAPRRDLERRLAPGILDRVQGELARLARKVYLAAPRRDRSAAPQPAARRSPAAGLAVERVGEADARAAALSVVAEVYQSEKGWIAESAGEIPSEPAADARATWYLARLDGEPAGVVRVTYDPPLALPAEAGVELEPGVDLDALAAGSRFAEVGRLMIRPAFRAKPAIVLGLMRALVGDVVERGCTHLLTAVFEDDPHSPYRFHTRQLGFERIGTHRRGELHCASRRILLVLDLGRAWRRLSSRRAAVAAELGRGLEARLARLAERGAEAAPNAAEASVAAS